MAERSVYDIHVIFNDSPYDTEERDNMNQSDTMAFLKSAISSANYGEKTVITITRKIPM